MKNIISENVSINKMLQEYIPMILENDIYFEKYLLVLLIKYGFEANPSNLRKKLEIHCRSSFYIEESELKQRLGLIKGKYKYVEENNRIWVSVEHIALIAKSVVKKSVLYISVSLEYVKQKYSIEILKEEKNYKKGYNALIEEYQEEDILAEFITPVWDRRETDPYSGIVLLRSGEVVLGIPDVQYNLIANANNQ